MPLTDFTNVKGFEVVEPVRNVPAVFEDYENKESKSGDEYTSLQFVVTAGEHEGRKFWRNVSYSEKSLPYVKRTMLNLGAPQEALQGQFNSDDIWDSLKGNDCLLDIKKRKPTDEYPEESNEITVKAFNAFVAAPSGGSAF